MTSYRKALLGDAERIYALANLYADNGEMLPRSRHQIYENIRDFIVAEEAGELIGVGALHVMWQDLAEVRTLAVAAAYKRKGVGRRVVGELLREGRELGVKKFFALTYQPDFFRACGFQLEDKNNMPQKIWMECVNCSKFPNCDEICMTIAYS